MGRVQLRQIAVVRGGDKWANLHLSVHILDPRVYEVVKTQLTSERIKELYGNEAREVDRYELPNVSGLNFVVHNALDGGISRSLRFDRRHSYAELLMDQYVDVP